MLGGAGVFERLVRRSKRQNAAGTDLRKARIMLSLPTCGSRATRLNSGRAQLCQYNGSVLLAAGYHDESIRRLTIAGERSWSNATCFMSEDVPLPARRNSKRGRQVRWKSLQGKNNFPRRRKWCAIMCFRRREKPRGARRRHWTMFCRFIYANEGDYRIQRLLALLEPTMLVVLCEFFAEVSMRELSIICLSLRWLPN